MAILHDTTENKFTEKALKESEEKFKNLAEQLPNMIFINKMGKIIYANQACENIMGYKIDELLSTSFNFFSLIAPDPESIDKVKSSFIKHENGEEVPPYEYKIITKQGKIIDVIISTKLINYEGVKAILGIVTDISERKSVEKALIESENRYRALFENAADAIFILDVEDNKLGQIVSANKAAAEMHGYTIEEITKLNINDLNAPESAKGVQDRINRVLSGEWIKQELLHIKKDGTIFPVEISAGLLEVDPHKYVLAFDRDITARKQMEDSLNQAKKELEKQNEELKKLDKIKDGLLRDVTHELKTPVAKQKMQMDLLKRVLDQNGLIEKCADMLNRMDASVRRQESVISNMLDLSRLEAGGKKYKIKPTRIDLSLKAVLSDYQSMIEAHNITIEKNLQAIIINTDQEMIFHVFSNLINNAIKFRSKIQKPYIGIFLEKNENNVTIKIVDNGIGLKEEEKIHIFERFYQASASVEGTGVGLAIAKMIVSDLGGKIWMQSNGENKGATVVVELPL